MRCALQTTIALLLAATASADLLVVDAAGGGSFRSVQAAVDAAQPGDVLLVRAGVYAGFSIAGKGLAVVAEEGALVEIQGSIDVSGLGGFERLVLAGLRVTGAAGEPSRFPELGALAAPALVYTANAGQARIQDCALTGGPGAQPGCESFGGDPEASGAPAVRVQDSGKLVLVGCALQGGAGGELGFETFCFDSWGGHGGDGLDAEGSQIALYDSSSTGGDGGEAGVVGGDGGHGGLVSPGAALLVNSVLAGGAGKTPWDSIALADGDGGHGLFVDTGGLAFLVDDVLVGGPVRGGPSFAITPGAPGEDLLALGTALPFAELPATLTGPNVVQAGERAVVTIAGAPGAEVYLAFSHQPTFVWNPSLAGVQAVALVSDLPHAILGTLPESGMRTLELALFGLAPEQEHDVIYAQLATVAPGASTAVLGTPHTFVMLE